MTIQGLESDVEYKLSILNPFNLTNWRTENIRVGTDAGDFKNKLKEYFENYHKGMDD